MIPTYFTVVTDTVDWSTHSNQFSNLFFCTTETGKFKSALPNSLAGELCLTTCQREHTLKTLEERTERPKGNNARGM